MLEHDLRVVRSGGYYYAAYKTSDGFDLYRTLATWEALPMSVGSTADPAAGAQLANITVPAGKRWLVLGLSYQITTDANVADRQPTLVFRADGTNTTSAVGTPVITASLTAVRVSFGLGGAYGGTAASNGIVFAGMGPGVELPASGNMQAYIYNIQATDNATIAYYVYKEAPA